MREGNEESVASVQQVVAASVLVTDEERRRVAERLRAANEHSYSLDCELVRALNGSYDCMGVRCDRCRRKAFDRLADIVEPKPVEFDSFDIDVVQRACFERMEGCDEPEWTLYTSIYDAIARYKRGESGLPEAAPCDRDALLALADEMDHPIRQAVWNQTTGVRREHIMAEYARRIREACGEAVA